MLHYWPGLRQIPFYWCHSTWGFVHVLLSGTGINIPLRRASSVSRLTKEDADTKTYLRFSIRKHHGDHVPLNFDPLRRMTLGERIINRHSIAYYWAWKPIRLVTVCRTYCPERMTQQLWPCHSDRRSYALLINRREYNEERTVTIYTPQFVPLGYHSMCSQSHLTQSPFGEKENHCEKIYSNNTQDWSFGKWKLICSFSHFPISLHNTRVTWSIVFPKDQFVFYGSEKWWCSHHRIHLSPINNCVIFPWEFSRISL